MLLCKFRHILQFFFPFWTKDGFKNADRGCPRRVNNDIRFFIIEESEEFHVNHNFYYSSLNAVICQAKNSLSSLALQTLNGWFP
jgi:hypothetical protein